MTSAPLDPEEINLVSVAQDLAQKLVLQLQVIQAATNLNHRKINDEYKAERLALADEKRRRFGLTMTDLSAMSGYQRAALHRAINNNVIAGWELLLRVEDVLFRYESGEIERGEVFYTRDD